MSTTDEIFEKSIWPCFSHGLFWALQDTIQNIAKLDHVEDEEFVEYEIDTFDLPMGEQALWRFNALRNIRVGLDDWPQPIQSKIISGTLCLGSKALETIERQGDDDLVFAMFKNDTILPLFVVDDETLKVRLRFKGLTQNEQSMIPMHAIHADGLYVKIKIRNKPFFVAGSADSILTWDGLQSHVFNKASMVPENTENLERSAKIWNAVHDESSHFVNLWDALQMTPNSPSSEFDLAPRQ